MIRQTALGLLLFLSGCAHVAPECATHAGTPWLELSSQHFVLQTNLAPEEAKATTVQLERARASVLAAFPGGGGLKEPLEVVVFTNAAQLQDLSGDPLLEAALIHDWRGPLLLTASTAAFLESTQLKRTLHELAHHYSARSLKRWPRWFEEGLAIYLETITIDGEKQTATRGAAHQLKLGEVMRWGILPVQSLWAWDVEPDALNGLEQHRAASAWFWVHFLVNEHRGELDRFMRSLAEGDEPRAAWAAAFSALTPQAMVEQSEAYLAKRQTRSQVMELAQLNTAFTERTMSDAQVHALLARVAASTGAWPRARAEVQAAAALDAKDGSTQEQGVFTQMTTDSRVAAARRLTQENAQDPAGWLLLGLALPATDPERGQALALAVELDPKSFFALSELAAFRCAEARCPEGVQLAERAAALAPGDARIQASVAAVQRQAGLCSLAVVSQQRALEVLPQRASAGLRKQLQARLVEYQQCAR
jgi:hypothetical protein